MPVLRYLRRLAWPVLDSAAWILGTVVACVLRHDFEIGRSDLPGLVVGTAAAVVAQVAVGTAVFLYRRRYQVGTLDEAVTFTAVTTIVGGGLFGLNAALDQLWLPRTVPLSAVLITLSVSGVARLCYRRLDERRARPSRSARRVIVFGAGRAGQQLVTSMLSGGDYLPVAMLDDDPEQWGRRVSGVSVRGGRAQIAVAAGATGADTLVVAVPSAETTVVRDVAQAAIATGLTVKVLPPLSELFRPWVGLSDMRDLDVADLLGRRQIDTDITAIADRLSGRRVLVTGAGGSIGSELCRQIHRFGPAELIMLDRDESALHGVQLSIRGHALLDTSDVVLADIRDAAAIDDIFARRRPDVVFHAAALKHLPMLEQYPAEAWKSNVVGTRNVLAASVAAGVEVFVNISTDKAADPTSVLGRSKRIGERLVADTAATAAGTYLSVRFGNVLGSRGSVLTTFAEQLAGGIPITITHPDVTRYFMTIPEAVQLVVQAAAIGAPGEVLVLDMGEPVRIVDLARQLMEIVGKPMRIVYTGLRDGEKLHEELFGAAEERDHRPMHPSISHVAVPPLAGALVARTGAVFGPAEAMIRLATEPRTPRTGAARTGTRVPSPRPRLHGTPA